jgi:hypothetical protein
MRWIAPLQLVWMATFSTAGFGFWIGEPIAAGIVGLVSLTAWLSFGFLACPRCGLHIGRRKIGGLIVPSLKPLPTGCPRCGRSRLDVYPFQRLVASERDDGGPD